MLPRISWSPNLCLWLMWGSLQLDWLFFLVVVVNIITSCSTLLPQMIVSTALLCLCLSVISSLLHVAAPSSPHLPRFVLIKTLLTSLICPIARLSSDSVSCLRRQKHGAFPESLSLIASQTPFSKTDWSLFYFFIPEEWFFFCGVSCGLVSFSFVVLGLCWGDSDSVPSCHVFLITSCPSPLPT